MTSLKYEWRIDVESPDWTDVHNQESQVQYTDYSACWRGHFDKSDWKQKIADDIRKER